MNIRQLKQKALNDIDNSVFSKIALNLLGYTLLVSILTGFAGLTFLGALIIGGPLSYGLYRISTKLSRGDRMVSVDTLFEGFKECFVETFLLNLMTGIYLFLWSMLFIIPGIVKSYSYSLAFYIQQDSRDKSWKTCLDKSKELMNGFKMKAFLLDLSFIGWYLLGMLAFGIGIYFVVPYHMQARSNLYNEILKANGYNFEGEPIQEELA